MLWTSAVSPGATGAESTTLHVSPSMMIWSGTAGTAGGRGEDDAVPKLYGQFRVFFDFGVLAYALERGILDRRFITHGLIVVDLSILLLTVDHPFAELVDQLACGPAHAGVQGCAHPLPTSMMPPPLPVQTVPSPANRPDSEGNTVSAGAVPL